MDIRWLESVGGNLPRESVKVDGTKIRHIRERQALLQRKELAKKVGVTPAAIYEIEVHRQSTQLPTLRKIARVLKVKPEELFA